MNKLIKVLKKLVISVIIIFCVSLLVENMGFSIPVNIFSISSYFLLGLPGLITYIVIILII